MTKTMCGADHKLVASKLNLRIQSARRPQGKKAPKRLNVSKLNQDSMRQAFLTDNCNQLDAINLSSENPEENWTVSIKQFILQLLLLDDIHLTNIKTGLMRMMTKSRGFLNKNAVCTRHIKMMLAQYPRKQPTATFVRQSRPSLGTCKIPG